MNERIAEIAEKLDEICKKYDIDDEKSKRVLSRKRLLTRSAASYMGRIKRSNLK